MFTPLTRVRVYNHTYLITAILKPPDNKKALIEFSTLGSSIRILFIQYWAQWTVVPRPCLFQTGLGTSLVTTHWLHNITNQASKGAEEIKQTLNASVLSKNTFEVHSLLGY
jgi:hypothetical protein